jgi:hypothetical protein
MEPTRFDRIATLFAERRLTRRRAVQHGTAGLAAMGLAAGLRTSAAQDATPVTDASPAASGETDKTEFLFVQSFESGEIAPKDGADGMYTVTLQHGLGQTLYFSDRPERIVGATPTQQFLDGFDFSSNNPPNAALVIGSDDGETDIAVIELTNPTYDEASSTATYDVSVLENYASELDMQFQEAPADFAAVASSFGTAHLFIDDACDDSEVFCRHWNDDGYIIEPDDPSLGVHAMCWDQLAAICLPCDSIALGQTCGIQFPDFCTDDNPCAVTS